MTINYDDLVLEDLNYNSYLKIPDLLSLQQQVSYPPHHDEMFFIIIHQTAELWFKLALHETSTLVDAFRSGIISRALKTMKRIQAIMNLQVQQIRLLSTLTPVEFAGFRDLLRPASGFQSAQFREVEFTYGVRNPFFLKFFDKLPKVKDRLTEIMNKPSVYDEVWMSLQKAGCPVPDEVLNRDYATPWQTSQALTELVRELYENPKDHYHWVLLFESMMDLDENLCLWRKTHAVMVARTIGSKAGTGGSTGFNFLTSRENLHCFPELWEVRNLIGGNY